MSSEQRIDNRGSIRPVVILWVVLTIIAEAALAFGLAPHMPPGRASAQASDQTTTNIVLAAIMIPIAVGLWAFFGYCLITFSERRSKGSGDGPPVIGNGRLELSWLIVTAGIVLCLAGYGTYALYTPDSAVAGAGGGQGPHPITSPPNTLVVQVIAQQWQFTYRYPQYGGTETFNLVIPANRTVEFNVTSLDVVHSFWAYELGVKADAVPGANNIAYVETHGPTSFSVRCAELCGVWHGEMSATGHVVSAAGFKRWIANQQIQNIPIKRYLPPYAESYFPDPTGRAG